MRKTTIIWNPKLNNFLMENGLHAIEKVYHQEKIGFYGRRYKSTHILSQLIEAYKQK
ncbi:hypothetical protein [Bacillus cihuensis]|uniref:hypothetical protein n=1 Tax=Bacillus cihuensis TaxID=1208599 RepID=UPI0004143C5E|nr:hypothetical protein [Bacillus cihuensis]